jgi:murein DD-endopeptidase MepM/ murein hydrolase activator NlpD
MNRKFIFLFVLGVLLSSCSLPQAEIAINEDTQAEAGTTQEPTWTPPPIATEVPPTPEPDTIDQICSPLDGDSIEELEEIITQPFKAPRPGHDDGHHGVDFAYFRRKDRLSIDGVKVLAALEGTVVTALNNRWPYGNAVIIETPLKSLDPDLVFISRLPARVQTVLPDPKMGHCQSGELSFDLNMEEESLYILYSHFQNPPDVNVGDVVQCGQPIGQVGNTGDSSNPHLHVETRIGPSGARFESMAYYIVDASASERYNYCEWRVTNLFQVFDAMLLFSKNNQ